jgi:hypothetical protein
MAEDLSIWLQLREAADAAARSPHVTRTIVQALAGHDPVHVLDLATGTGSNLRYLAPRLPSRQRWLVVDHDPTLLARLPTLTSSWGAAHGYQVTTEPAGCVVRGARLDVRVETRCLDLNRLDHAELFTGRHLVTASALLDLVSARWLQTLAARCREGGAAALFALSYNGWSSCLPVEPEDELVRGLMNRHQRRDKGLGGPAAGPEAAAGAVRCFAEAGYRVLSERSDWALGPAEPELQRRLIDGWAHASAEAAPGDAARIERWRLRRIGHVKAGRSHLAVGHLDVGAWLPAAAGGLRAGASP